MEPHLSKSSQLFTVILCALWVFAQIQEAKGARIENPPLSWTEDWYGHNEILTRVYHDEYVAFYFDSKVNQSLDWPFDDITQVWKYVQTAYNLQPSSTDQRLYIIIHEGKFKGYHTSTFPDASHGFKNVIDCGQTLSEDEKCSVEQLIEKVLQIIWSIISRTEGWPKNSYSIWDIWTIFWRDIKKNTQLRYQSSIREHADRWQNVVRWYRPIYDQYGGSKVVKNFIKLIKAYTKGNGRFDDSELNLGSLVYIWSQAAGADLKIWAKNGLEWTNTSESQFQFAQERFSSYTYQALGIGAPAEDTTKEGSTSEKKNPDMTLIIILSAAAIIIVLIIVFFVLHRRQMNVIRAEIRELKPSEIKEFYDGGAITENTSGYSKIQSTPFNKQFEIPKQNLNINNDKILGSGQYGLVLKGRLLTPGVGGKKPEDVEVAIKTPKPDVDVTTFKALLSELKIMGYLGKHKHIAALHGAVTVNIKNRELFVALEYCDQGDLLSVIKARKHFTDIFNNKSHRNDNDAAHSSDVTKYLKISPINVELELEELNEPKDHKHIRGVLSTTNLLEWSHQIADGMDFISSKDVIHGDLAARNVLITADNVVKISDFGLSRQLVNYSNYLKKSEVYCLQILGLYPMPYIPYGFSSYSMVGKGIKQKTESTPVPWRWMAIESLQHMDFSVKSDVWAFGVTLYEIFSLGAIPYAGANWTTEFVDNLVAGHRLGKPTFANDDVYSLMMDCMRSEANERISFPEAFEKLMEIKITLRLSSKNSVVI